MAENKIVEYSGSIDVGSINDSSTLYCRPLTPYTCYFLLQQGLTQQERIGNAVRPVTNYVIYVVRPNGYNIATYPNPSAVDFQMFLGLIENESGVTPPAERHAGLVATSQYTVIIALFI